MTTNTRLVAMWTLLAVIAACGLLGVVAIVAPSRFIDERVLATGFVVGMHALGAMVLIAFGRDQPRLLAAALAALTLSMLLFSATTVLDNAMSAPVQEWSARFGAACVTITLVLGHRMLVAPMLRDFHASALVRITKRAALVSATVAGAIILIPILLDDLTGGGEILMRLFGIGLIVAAASTLALGAMALLMKRPGDDEPGLLSRGVSVAMTCPRCARPIDAVSGRESRCEGCRLRVRVTLEEPRCACGYLLYELKSDTCPECGREIPEGDRWGRSGMGVGEGGDGRGDGGNGQGDGGNGQ